MSDSNDPPQQIKHPIYVRPPSGEAIPCWIAQEDFTEQTE
jgi:hypothetical protein